MSKKRKRFFIRTLISLVIIAAIGYSGYRLFFQPHVVNVGDQAPDFVLHDLQGKRVHLKDLRGKGVMLNFWGSWCYPCKDEMPFINQAYHEVKDWGNVVILEIDLGESKQDVTHYKKKLGLDFPVWMDSKGKVKDAYAITGVPTTYFIDKTGHVVAKKLGAMQSKAEIMEKLKQIQP